MVDYMVLIAVQYRIPKSKKRHVWTRYKYLNCIPDGVENDAERSFKMIVIDDKLLKI